jgi:hypothetical protein
MSNERAAFSSARATLGTLLLADGRIMLASSSVLAQVHGSQRSQFQDASHGVSALSGCQCPAGAG